MKTKTAMIRPRHDLFIVVIAYAAILVLNVPSLAQAPPEKILFLKDPSGQTVAFVDKTGNFVIKGNIEENVSNIAPTVGTACWTISEGSNIIALIEIYNPGTGVSTGNMRIAKTLQQSANPPDTGALVIKDNSTPPVPIWTLETDGDLVVKGSFFPNSDPNGPTPPARPVPVPMPSKYYCRATICGDEVVPAAATYGRGPGSFVMETSAKTLSYDISVEGTSAETSAQILGPATRGQNATAPALYTLPLGAVKKGVWYYAEGRSPSEVAALESDLRAGHTYVLIKSSAFPDGEIRGQIDPDRDADGVTDYEETTYYGTNPLDRDSDDDGLLDGEEIRGLGKLSHMPQPFDYVQYLALLAGPLDEGNNPPDAEYFRKAYVTNPLDWDTDDDQLADGLEVGVTEPVQGFVQDSTTFLGTNFPDANQDGLHDILGYRLVDLAPSEPITDPKDPDTNSNGGDDGGDDANRNGRIDAGETDPVFGFYIRQSKSCVANGEIQLLFDDESPLGVGYYGEFYLDFGSSQQSEITLTASPPGNTVITPSTFYRSAGRTQAVTFFVPGESGLADSTTILAGSSPTATLKAPTASRFSSWVKDNFAGAPPTNYRADCGTFCKMALWRYYGGSLNTATRDQVNPVAHPGKLAWGTMRLFRKTDPNPPGRGDHFIVYPNAIDVEHVGIGIYKGGTTNLFDRWPLGKVEDANSNGVRGISGALGDEGRFLDWDDLRPGDMFFLNYHDDAHPHNYGVHDTGPERVDHVVMLVELLDYEWGTPATFCWGTYWSYLPGYYYQFSSGYSGTAPSIGLKPYGAYLPETARLPLTDSGAGYQTPLDYREIQHYPGETPGGLIKMHDMNSLDEYLKLESGNVVGANNWLKFVEGIRRWRFEP